MHLDQWISDELAELRRRTERQVLGFVPAERRLERPGGGNSVAWGLWHVARHADLALHGVLLGEQPYAGLEVATDVPPGCGLGEAEEPIIEALDPGKVERYVLRTLDEIERWWQADSGSHLDDVPDSAAVLAKAGIEPGEFDWLYAAWDAKPVAFFVRWELLGHIANHLGEMTATRNRMGLSPF
jgi:hypothetical protein